MESRHENGEGPPWFTSGKNVLILALVVVALVQGYLLFRQSPPPDLRPREAKEQAQAAGEGAGDIVLASAKQNLDAGSGQETTASSPAASSSASSVSKSAVEDGASEVASAQSETGVSGGQEQATTPAAEQVAEKVAVKITAVTVEDDLRRYVLLSFDQPLGEGKVGLILDKAPGDFNPEQYGSWSWISPFTLRFDFAQPLAAGETYYLNLKPDVFLSANYRFEGDTFYALRTEHFQVVRCELSEDFAPDEPGKSILKVAMEFSYPVDPGELLKHLRLIDPLRGENAPVELRMLTGYRTQWHEVQSEPLAKEQEPRTLVLSLEPGLQDAAGDLTLAEGLRREFALKLDPDLDVRKAMAQSSLGDSSLTVTFSTPVDSRTAGAFVHVAPEAEFSLSGRGRDLMLTGNFQPGREYVLILDKGLTAADGAVLRKGYRETLAIPDLEPAVRFQDPGIFLPRLGSKNLAVESVNIPSAKLFIDRVYANNIFALLQDYSGNSLFEENGYKHGPRHYLGDRIVEKDLTLPAPKNQPQHTTLDVQRFVEGKGPGFYRLFLGQEDSWEGSQRWVLVTDLGIVAKKGEDDVLVWVNSFADLAAVEGVRMTLLSDQNQVIAQGFTDAQGLWRASNLAKAFEEHSPYMVVAEKDGDYGFLLFDRFKIDQSGQDVGGERVSKRGYMAYVYGERDIYRPGETLEGVVLLRSADLATPSPMPLTILQKDPNGKELSKRVVHSDERGVASLSYDVPGFALTGDYRLEVLVADTVIATYRYKVEEFMPDRIKVEIAPEKTAFAPGEELRYDVASRYFFGPPASDLPVESVVRLEAAPFAPSGYAAYSFGDPEIEFERREITAGKPDTRLDAEGHHSFAVSLPEDLKPPASLEAQLFARVSERGGRGVGAMQRVSVHPYPRYPGLKNLEDKGVDPGSRVKAQYVVLTPQGKETPGASLRLDFYKDRWQTVLRSTPSGGVRYDSVRDSVLLSSKRVENAPATGALEVTPPDYGSYRVVLTDEAGGAASQVSFYAGGWGYSPWAIENPAHLDIVADKDEYAPGESATLQIRTPFSGKLLLAVEGDEVRDTQVIELEKRTNTATVSVTMREEYSPNVYVTGVLVRSAKGLASGDPGRAYGATPLNVDRTANKVAVRISAPEQIRPETTLEVALETEPDSVVTLAAVDEGILQLIAQETPDPFARFYVKRALGVDSYDIYSMLFPDVPPAENTAVAGGGGVDRLRQFVRSEGLRRVKPVAFWSGPLVTDAQGKAAVKLDVPEFQGALRLMAVVSKGREFGSNHGLTRVRSPLVLTPTLPRFLSPGDTVLVPVTLRNDVENDVEQEGADEPFALDLKVTGQATVAVDHASLQVRKGTEELVYFKVTVGDEPSGLSFAFTAQGQGESAKATVDVPVRASLPARTRVAAGTLEKKSLELSVDAAGLVTQGLRREVHVGGVPLVRFTDGLKQLLGYPYGCLEQTVSKAFPLLYYEALAGALAPEDLEGHQPAAMAQQGVTRVLTMQLADGNFCLWPGGDKPYPWGSLYATHFLLEARQAGFHVPESAMNLALDAAAEQLRWKQEPKREDLERMAYAHFVLAKAGRPDRGGLDYLRNHFAGRLSAQSVTLLAGAYGLQGDMRAMDKTLAMPVAKPVSGRETGGNLNSPLRNTAMRLVVMLDTMPDDGLTPQLVQQLASLMEATPYRSTQENGLAYVALGRFYAKQQKKKPFSGAVYLGDRMLGTFGSEKPLHMGNLESDAPLRIEMDENVEPGAVFYSVLTRGVPTETAYEPASQGLALERRYLTREGKPLPEQGVKQGELVVLETRIRSLEHPVANVVLQALLPAGLEVENPRLETTEQLPWAQEKGASPDHQDLRDDRVLLFLGLPGPKTSGEGTQRDNWQTYYSVLRAVSPGEFALPPLQAEAMYDPQLLAAGEPGRMRVLADDPDKGLQPPQGTLQTDGVKDGVQDAMGETGLSAAGTLAQAAD